MAEVAYFVVVASDAPGKDALRESLRPRHRAWLREHPGHAVDVLHGGPTLDANGRMNGTVLIVAAPDEHAARAFVHDDPYVRGELFHHWEMRRWAWTLGRRDDIVMRADSPS